MNIPSQEAKAIYPRHTLSDKWNLQHKDNKVEP